MSAETVHQEIDRDYYDIAAYIADSTSLGELDILFEGTYTVPKPVGVELRRRVEVRFVELVNRPLRG